MLNTKRTVLKKINVSTCAPGKKKKNIVIFFVIGTNSIVFFFSFLKLQWIREKKKKNYNL